MSGRNYSPFFESDLNNDISRLPAPYNAWKPYCEDPNTISIHHKMGMKSQLNYFTTKALLAYCEGEKAEIGVVKMGKASYVSQWTQQDGSSIIASANRNKLYGAVRSANGCHEQIKRWSERESKFDLSSIFLLYLLIEADLNEEKGIKGTDAHTITWDFLNRAKTQYDLAMLSEESVYLICDDLRYAIQNEEIPTGIRMGAISTLPAQRIEIQEFRSGTIVCGNPDLLKPERKTGENFVTVAEAKQTVMAYTSSLHWSSEEEELIPQFSDDTPVPPEVMKMVTRFVNSRGLKLPFNNFCWRGVTAYGKSTGIDIMACILHTPKMEFTCSFNTEEQDFHAQFIPNEALSAKRIYNDLPTFEEISYDPEFAYEKLTGQTRADVTSEEVLKAYGDVVASRSGSAHFKLVVSDYMKALVNGYIIEVQEFSRIRDSGVLVKLNKYDRPGSVIQLVNGEHRRRHENAIVVFTDNIGYNSCRPVDPSVLRRMSFIIDSYEMPKDRALKRVKENTGCKDEDRLDKMYYVWNKISEYCKEQEITEGAISLAELERWVSVVELEGISSMIDACQECIVAKATSSPEDQKRIMDECVMIEIKKVA